MSRLLKALGIILGTIFLTLGIVFVVIAHPTLNNLHLDTLLSFLQYTHAPHDAPQNPGHVVFLVKGSDTTIALVQDISIDIRKIEIQKPDGSWQEVATTSKQFSIITHTEKDIGIALQDITLPQATYVAVRYTFGTTTILSTTDSVEALMPSQQFTIPIQTYVKDGTVSTLTLKILAKQSLFKNKTIYSFAPYAYVESRADAQVFTTSDLKTALSFNDGTLEEIVQAQMYAGGETGSIHIALAGESGVTTSKSVTSPKQPSSNNPIIVQVPVQTKSPSQPYQPPQPIVPTPTARPIIDPNTTTPLVFDYVGSQEIVLGGAITFRIHASGAQGLYYSAANIPTNANFNTTTGVFSWTPTAAGNYPAVFTATDGVNTISLTVIMIVDSQTVAPIINVPVQPPIVPTRPLRNPTIPPITAIGTTFNVKDYGALGDGMTDDISSINKAVADLVAAKGGTLYFPQGTYRISSAIEIRNLSNFKIIGDSATIKQIDGSYINYYTISNLYLEKDSNFTIQGLTLDGNGKNRLRAEGAGNTLMLRGATNFFITGNTFINSICDDIYIYAYKPSDDSTASHDGVINNNTLTGAYRNAISIIHGSNLTISGNTIQNVYGTAPGSGIDIESNQDNSNPFQGDTDSANHNITISNNIFKNNEFSGIAIPFILHPTRITIDSNTFDNNPTSIFDQGVIVTVTNNTFKNDNPPDQPTPGWASYGAVYADYAKNATLNVTGNTFTNNTKVAAVYIFRDWSGQLTIAHNTVTNAPGLNINTDNAVITDNIFRNMNYIGIGVAGHHIDIERNVLTNVSSLGIYSEGGQNTISNNTLTDVGFLDRGLPIQTIYGTGGNIIDNNTITKTVPDLTWKVIDAVSSDTVTNNTIKGLLGDPALSTQ